MGCGRKDQFGKLEILGMGKAISGGVLRGIVANIDKTVESIKQAVEEAEQKSGVEIKEVYIGIAGQHIKSLQHRGELVRDDIENEITFDDMEKLRENMFKLVTVPGEEVIHVIPQEYTVDGEDGILWVGDGLTFGYLSYQYFVFLGKGYHGRCGPSSLGVCDDCRVATFHNCYYRVGCTQIDSDDFSHNANSFQKLTNYPKIYRFL